MRSGSLLLLGALGVSFACSPVFAGTPYINSISPSSATAGANAFVLTVNGREFNSRSVVLWNGSPRSTILVNSWKVQAQISKTDIASPKTVNVKAINSRTGQTSGVVTFKVLSAPPQIVPLAITTSTLPPATVGASYSAALTATGGTPPYVWSLASGQLPQGLTLSSFGKISGTPASAGTSYFSVQAQDAAASPQAVTRSELIAASVAGSNITPPPQATGYTLMFSDDFNSLNLSPNGVGSFNWYDPGMFWESPAPYSNISTSNSALSLLWKNGQGTSDTSLATAAKDGSSYHAWRYGYFEARMRWDTVTGAWPAIWLIPVQGITCGGCEQGELDIFEGQGASPNVFTGTIHDWNSPTGAHSAGKNYNLGSVDLSQYHTYGVLWTPGQVTWYFDNQALYSFPTYSIFDQQKYYLIIGSQEGANWSYGNLSNVTASQIGVNVDWVRVWQP
jgi:hypothetical protein